MTNKKKIVLTTVVLAALGASVAWCPWLQRNLEPLKALIVGQAEAVAPVESH